MTDLPTAAHPTLEVKEVDLLRPIQWVALAWQDMERAPRPGFMLGALMAGVGAALFWMARNDFWWIAGMLSACMIFAPVLVTGLYDISRRLERGERTGFRDSLRIWRTGDKRLIHFGLLLALSSAGWLLCSAALIHALQPKSVYSPADFLKYVVLQPEIGLFEIWLLMSALIAALMFASTLVTIPLLLDHPSLTVWQAVNTSWRVVALNPLACTFWACLLFLFTSLGIGSAFLGLLPVVPMLAHASWHAYRDLVTYDPAVH